jgi:uridine kinase
MTNLIQGEAVALPVYDFKNGIRSFGKPIQVEENQPIIIEGIHALNPKLTPSIPEAQKYKIYIAPQPQVNIDNHTPVSMTDMRLLRRIARDSRTRGSDATETINMWPNVRSGEFKYIYPTQENADFVFDSFFPYEPCALRNIVLPLLDKVRPDQKEYLTASRLKQMVKYFLPIPTNNIPCNSLMREFVGGSSFKDAR